MIYLVYGDQYPLVSKRVKRLVKSILLDEIDEFSYVRVSAKEVLMQDIEESSLFGISFSYGP